MRRVVMGLASVSLAAVVMTPAGAIGRGAYPEPAPTERPQISLRVALCQSTFPDRVVAVTLTRTNLHNPEHFTFPAQMRGAKPALVRALATALCSLPLMPAGERCPADWGPTYSLQFALPESLGSVGGESRILPASVQTTGCELVRGGEVGTPWVARSPRFFTTLGAAIGLRHATRATFAGELATSGG